MIKKVTEDDNFSALLIGLTFLLFIGACVDQFEPGHGQHIVIASAVITMVSGVWSIRSDRFAFNTGIGLTFGVIVVYALSIFLDKAELDFLHLLLMLIFFSITLILASEQALFSGKVTGNNIIGSICIFLLLGLIWAILFLLIGEFIPESFSGIKHDVWQKNFSDVIYFSFVTLTTLGFGDLLPISPLARFLVYMEAIIGIFYMAIVVSSLVAAKMSEIQNKH